MGLFGGLAKNTATILGVYKADTKDITRKLKKLRGDEKKLLKDQLQSIEASNASLDSQIGKWGKVALGIGAVAGAWVTAKAALGDYLEDSKLTAASAGVDIERLKQASGGLVSELDLLKTAAAAMNTDFKLSQKELENVNALMVVLTQQGNEATDVINAVRKSMAEGSVEELGKFGLAVSGISKGLEGHNALMRIAAEEAKNLADVEGDDVRRAMVRADDATRNLSVAFGKLAASLAPLIEGLSVVLEKLAAIPDGIDRAFKGDRTPQEELQTVNNNIRRLKNVQRIKKKGGGTSGLLANPLFGLAKGIRNPLDVADVFTAGGDLADLELQREILKAEIRNQREQQRIQREGFGVDKFFGAVRAITGRNSGAVKGSSGTRGRGSRGAKETGSDPIQNLIQRAIVGLTGGIGTGLGDLQDFQGQSSELGGIGKGLLGDIGSALEVSFAGASESLGALVDGIKAIDEQELKLDSIFGPVGQFNEFAAGFDLLRDAATAAFDAWITGSESLGMAIKKALGEGLRALAKDMFVQSLSHGAHAIGNLAFGNPVGAAKHAQAAAVFAAGAIVAGKAAGALGAGGGSSTAASVGGGAGARAGGSFLSRGQQGNSQTIIVGGDFELMSSRERLSRLDRANRSAKNREGDTGAVIFGG